MITDSPCELPWPDHLHLREAEGWLDFGDHLAANLELDRITPQLRVHPEVLRLRYWIYRRAGNLDMAAETCKALCRFAPQSPFGYIQLAKVLHRMTRITEAVSVLTPVVDLFPGEWMIPYNLASYHSQLGHMQEAVGFLQRAIAAEAHVRELARAEPDLGKLLEQIGEA